MITGSIRTAKVLLIPFTKVLWNLFAFIRKGNTAPRGGAKYPIFEESKWAEQASGTEQGTHAG